MNKQIRKALTECASYQNGCIFDNPCRVEEGDRCSWFEQAVLPRGDLQGARLQYEVACVRKTAQE